VKTFWQWISKYDGMTALKTFHFVVSTGEESFDPQMNHGIAKITLSARNDIR
jgi:hypothetical protein